MTELVGKTLGGYKLVEAIGTGGLAVVYKAYQPNLERWIALKVLHYKDDETLIRFQREAQTIARLRHRNIVIVYEYGQDGDWPYIAMEYIEGGTLADRLTGGRSLEWSQVINLALPIADALDYAHRQGVIHRDIKPSNVLMPQEDWPLLADFGLVKLPDADFVLTGEGVAMGTPAYISPEQARGAPVDNRTDMYSLGVVMFEMLTGRLPFNYPNPNKIMLAHISEPPPAPGRFCADCPPALEEIILTTLQKSPDARYGDMRVMANALKEALVVSKPRPPIEAAPPPEILGTVNLAAPSGQTSRPTPAARPQPRLILPDRGADLPLPDQDSLIIGRTHRQTIADIDLGPYGAAENGVSRQHARLTRQAHGWLLDDLGSLNGTFINEVKVTPSQPVLLKDGDVVRCSHLSFTFRL